VENIEELPGMKASGASNIVRVSVAPSVYFKLDAIQKIQKDILGRLGCRACCSGWDIRFDLQRQFIVDEKLQVREIG
jgi:hypothetical protein